jgi:hypothetical protein
VPCYVIIGLTRDRTQCSLNASECSPNAAKCSPDTSKCSLNTAKCSPNTSKCSLNATKCSTNTSKCSLTAAKCSLNAVWCINLMATCLTKLFHSLPRLTFVGPAYRETKKKELANPKPFRQPGPAKSVRLQLAICPCALSLSSCLVSTCPFITGVVHGCRLSTNHWSCAWLAMAATFWLLHLCTVRTRQGAINTFSSNEYMEDPLEEKLAREKAQKVRHTLFRLHFCWGFISCPV